MLFKTTIIGVFVCKKYLVKMRRLEESKYIVPVIIGQKIQSGLISTTIKFVVTAGLRIVF